MHRVSPSWAWLAVALLTGTAGAQEYKIEAHKEAPPSALAAEVRGVLAGEGYKVVDGKGAVYAEFWLRKAVPAASKPAGFKGTIQFPFLAEGELIGALRFAGEGHDYRDQSIPKGVYTMRYGLQPVNGDHLGVSPFRDYVLLVPAAKDADPAALAQKKLETRSAETVGSSHPAILMLVEPPAGTKADPKVLRDDAKNISGVVLALPLSVANQAARESLIVQPIIVGSAM